jgi:succinate dehydrogenase hydrophobic anchor subunit
MKNLTFLNINKLLHFFYFSDGLIHWLIQRIAAVCILLSTLIFFYFDLFFIFFLVFIFFHIFVGIRTLLDDYVHDSILFLLSNIFLRITIIYFLKILFIIFLC